MANVVLSQVYSDIENNSQGYDLYSKNKIKLREKPPAGLFSEELIYKCMGRNASGFSNFFRECMKNSKVGSYPLTSQLKPCVILTLKLEIKRISKDGSISTIESLLNLVKLHPSERFSKESATTATLKEAVSIGRSRGAFGSCIEALSQPRQAGRLLHIPVRDSLTTRYLKDAFGGSMHCSIIGFWLPDTGNNTLESVSTLRMLSRAKTAVNNVNRDNVCNSYLIDTLSRRIPAHRVASPKSDMDHDDRHVLMGDAYVLPNMCVHMCDDIDSHMR